MAPPKKKNKKRKRPDPEEQLQQERQERYEKLVYQAKKAIHKEAKVVKSFECQKVVRKIKESSTKNETLETRLASWKQFSIDIVVDACIRRLGIPNLNPKADVAAPPPDDDKQDFIEKMLKQKRLVTVMETWDEKVAEYRRWYLRRQDVVTGVPDFVQQYVLPKKSKKNKQNQKDDADDPTGGIFVSLGGPQDEEEEQLGEEFHYGPASGMVMVKKKNRPGQRQRKAKAMAIEARKEGRTLDRSFNVREKKQKDEHDEEKDSRKHQSASKDVKPKQVEASKIAEMGKTWKEEGKAHPSWAARSSEKTGIVAFAGKKITFD